MFMPLGDLVRECRHTHPLTLAARADSDVDRGSALVQPTRTRRVLVTTQPKRVAVDETTVKINGEWFCLYPAIDLDTTLLPDVQLFR